MQVVDILFEVDQEVSSLIHLILENYIKILSFKGEATVKEVVNVMKETIPDLTENKVKKIWCGILQPR